MMKRLSLLIVCLICGVGNIRSWGFLAHRTIHQNACLAMPKPLFDFYKLHINYLIDHATDPDNRRYVVENEACKHFMDCDFYETTVPLDTLPKDCINLTDENQVKYYNNNTIVQKALSFLERRRLLLAVNRPNNFYISLTDKVHKNRIVIPFYDDNGKIIHYQTRTILEVDELTKPRYLSKVNSDKTIFNIDKIDHNYDTIFVFEGPFNSCFVKNGVAIGGIQENSYQLYTARQQEQINKFPFHKIIWVLDSQWKDKAALNKTKKLLQLKEKVFLWPTELSKFKDFNDIMIAIKDNHISPEFIKKYTK